MNPEGIPRVLERLTESNQQLANVSQTALGRNHSLLGEMQQAQRQFTQTLNHVTGMAQRFGEIACQFQENLVHIESATTSCAVVGSALTEAARSLVTQTTTVANEIQKTNDVLATATRTLQSGSNTFQTALNTVGDGLKQSLTTLSTGADRFANAVGQIESSAQTQGEVSNSLHAAAQSAVISANSMNGSLRSIETTVAAFNAQVSELGGVVGSLNGSLTQTQQVMNELREAAARHANTAKILADGTRTLEAAIGRWQQMSTCIDTDVANLTTQVGNRMQQLDQDFAPLHQTLVDLTRLVRKHVVRSERGGE